MADLATPSHGQLQTIPDALARAGTSLTSGASIPSGMPPPLDWVLARTEVIVRGQVGEPRSYLSADQTELLTDHALVNPVVLYRREGPTPVQPGQTQAISVTILGGMVSINGLTFTTAHAELPRLEPGTDAVFCLERVDGHNQIVGRSLGAFRVDSERLVPLTRIRNFAPEMQQLAAAQMIADLVAKTRALPKAVR